MDQHINERLQKILKEYLYPELNLEELNEDDFLANYGLDSTGILKLIVKIEEEFGFEVRDEDFDNENFQTISCLKIFIKSKIEEENRR